MNETIQFLLEHGYIVLFIGVLIDQIGIPLPVLPLLLTAGALSGTGQLDLVPAILLAATGSFLSNILWYEMGRHYGSGILSFICKISFEPDACIRRTEDTFHRFGKGSLIIAKFIPGLNTVASPVAGVFKMSRFVYLTLNAAGALLWASVFIGLGYLLRDQLEEALNTILDFGGSITAVLVTIVILYAGIKYFRRHFMIRSLRIARITPDELKNMMDANIELAIVDLRHTLDMTKTPQTLPNAIQIAPEELSKRHTEIPPNRQVILFCT